MGGSATALFFWWRHNSDKNVGIDPNFFQVTITNKVNKRTKFHENRTNREMHVEILTIVIRFMGGFPTAFSRSRDGQPEVFFQKIFHHDLGEEKA